MVKTKRGDMRQKREMAKIWFMATFGESARLLRIKKVRKGKKSFQWKWPCISGIPNKINILFYSISLGESLIK
jgi:hypothetical protein